MTAAASVMVRVMVRVVVSAVVRKIVSVRAEVADQSPRRPPGRCRALAQGMPTMNGTSNVLAPAVTCTRPSSVWPGRNTPGALARTVQRNR